MDVIRTTFLSALRAALLGQTIAPDKPLSLEEWKALLDMAQIHHVLPLIYEALYPVLQKTDPALASSVKRNVLHQVMIQAQKTSDFLSLNQTLHAAGIRPLVVKGLILRDLYPHPDSRASGDEDVLIPEEQFSLCHQVLSDYGLRTSAAEDTFQTAYEIPYRAERGPLYIELHKQLFPPESSAYGFLNTYFADVHKRAMTAEIQQHTVYTLSCTDHLFYLICHVFKHFLYGGFGIRQVCDIVLFSNRYGNRIDWNLVLEHCRQIRADRFAAALFRIGERYLVFDPEKAAYPGTWRAIVADEEPLLQDILSSGLYGDATMSRKHSSNITLAAASRKGKKNTLGAAFASAFPPPKKLTHRYPYLKKQPWLVPAAWLDRLVKYSKESRQSPENTAMDALKIGNQRVELLRLYGIVSSDP